MIKKISVLVYAFMMSSIITGYDFPLPNFQDMSRHYIAYQSPEPLQIDGQLNEQSWSQCDWSEDFTDIEGSAKPKPFFTTKVKILWDKNYLYIGAWMEENDLWADLTERDAVVFFDNDFEVFIDPDQDTHDYCELEINALNTVWDLFIIKPYRDRYRVAYNSWDIKNLKTAVYTAGTTNDNKDKDQYWTVEIAIPWASLSELSPKKMPPVDNDVWKVNFSRVQWDLEKSGTSYTKIKGKPEHNWVWSPQGLIAMHYPELWGNVQFSHLMAGTGKAIMVADSLREEKSFMYQVYYAQKLYRAKYHNFAQNLDQLKKELPSLKKYEPILNRYHLDSTIGKTSYEMILIHNKSKKSILYLYEDGRLINNPDWDL